MPIRLRIALATALILAMSLLILGNGIYFTMSRSLHGDLNDRLRTVYDAYRRNPGSWWISPGEIHLEVEVDPFTSSGTYIQVLDRGGQVADKSANLGDQVIPVNQVVLEKNNQHQTMYYDANAAGQPLRVVSGRISDPVTGNLIAFVQVAEPTATLDETLADLRRNLFLGSVMTIVMLTLGAWLIGDAAMRPLAKMSQMARSIGQTGDLSQRLKPPRTTDEVQDLAETFNDMLSRLEETFAAQRRFVADASHELRTPLTALRANSDIMLHQIETGMFDPADLHEGLSDVRDEVDRMTRLVQNLLTLARADVGWRPEMERVDLAEVMRDSARIAAPLRRGQRFEIATPISAMPGDEAEVEVLGNSDQLTQLVLILLDNAFTYAPPDSDVTLTVDSTDDWAIMRVTDSGQGIAPEHQQHIFERFYRTDDARTRASGGTGLGLAIARWIATVHDGDISVESVPGRGTTFVVRLPLAYAGNERSVPAPQRRLVAGVAGVVSRQR